METRHLRPAGKEGAVKRRRRVRWASLLALALWFLACGGSSGAVSGKVLLDGAPAAGQVVLLQGGVKLLTATTGADGAYQFEDVPEGGYLLSVDVASTQERHVQVAVKVPASVPDLIFSGVGSLTGTVTDARKAPVSGAQVSVLGTQVSGSTDSAGHFAFSTVPTGARTVAVTSDAGTGQAEVALVLGETQDVAVQVSLGAPATVTGQAGFFSRTDLSIIEVSVPAAGLSTHADADGKYQLSVPPGDWDLYAKAPYYPSQKIGHVSVTSGQTVSLPAATLSLYTELPSFGVAQASWHSVAASRRTPRQVALLEHRVLGAPSSYYTFDVETHALRLLALGEDEPTLTADGHAAAVPQDNGVLVMGLTTGRSFFVPTSTRVDTDETFFSEDGSHAFFITEGAVPQNLYSVDVATGATSQDLDFLRYRLAPGRILVQTRDTAPITWKLASSAGVTTAFENVPTVDVSTLNSPLGTEAKIAYGVEDCAAPPCPLDLLAPGATVAVASDWRPADTSYSAVDSAGRWILMRDLDEYVVIDTTTGAATVLPAGTNGGTFSPDGTRLVFRTLTNALFEHALPLPDPATLAPLISASGGAFGGWISGNRYVGFADTPPSGAPYRFTIEGGVLTKDEDYEAYSEDMDDLYATWRDSGGGTHLITGTGPVLTAPEGSPTEPTLVYSELKLEATEQGPALVPAGRVFASWGDGKGWVFDGDTPPRALPVPLTPTFHSRFMGNLALLPSLVESVELLDVNSGQRVQLQEPGVMTLGLDLALGSEMSLVVASHPSSGGSQVGGAYALFPSTFISF